MRAHFALGAVATLTIVLSTAVGAQQPVPAAPAKPVAAPALRGRIVGVYDRDSGEPVDSAEVMDVLTGHGMFTTRHGIASLFFVDSGGGLIRIRKIGYEPLTTIVANSVRDTTPLTLVIHRVGGGGQVLDPVIVTDSAPHHLSARLQAFEQRRHEGFGRFVSEADLRKADDRQLSSVLTAHVPGIEVIYKKGSATIISHRDGGMCSPAVYIDDIADPDYNLVAMTVDRFAGVEYYSVGEVPAKYNTTVPSGGGGRGLGAAKSGAGCGVLLFWSRER